jgi:hypothetical protein
MTPRPAAGGLGMTAGEASGREVFVSIQHFLHRDDQAQSRVRVADDLILDAVWVKKIETAFSLIVGMAEGLETSSDHAYLGGEI